MEVCHQTHLLLWDQWFLFYWAFQLNTCNIFSEMFCSVDIARRDRICQRYVHSRVSSGREDSIKIFCNTRLFFHNKLLWGLSNAKEMIKEIRMKIIRAVKINIIRTDPQKWFQWNVLRHKIGDKTLIALNEVFFFSHVFSCFFSFTQRLFQRSKILCLVFNRCWNVAFCYPIFCSNVFVTVVF